MVGCWLHHLEDSEEGMVLAEGVNTVWMLEGWSWGCGGAI